MIPLVLVLLFLLTIDAGSSSSNGGRSSGSSTSSRKTARKKVTKKNTATTLKAVMAQYPELQDLSHEQRAVQYQAYLLHVNGATSEELDAYKPVNFHWFTCCKDGSHSTGCQWDVPIDPTIALVCDPTPNTPNSCEIAGDGWNVACCRSSPDSRVGSKDWFWNKCT